MKKFFPKSSRNLVPLPIICLNSVIDLIFLSKTINLVVFESTPVDINIEVVAMTGYFSCESMK